MTDTLTAFQRSRLMAAVRPRGNKTTEGMLAKLFRRHAVKSWRRHARILGRPDFVFYEHRLALFVDGCFWHGCPRHLRVPSSNRSYWRRKISRNKARDRLVTNALRRLGWRVLRLWEHELRNEKRALRLFEKAMAQCAINEALMTPRRNGN